MVPSFVQDVVEAASQLHAGTGRLTQRRLPAPLPVDLPGLSAKAKAEKPEEESSSEEASADPPKGPQTGAQVVEQFRAATYHIRDR